MFSCPRDLVPYGDGVFGLSPECDPRFGKTSAGSPGPCTNPEVYSDAGTLVTVLGSEADALARAGPRTPAYYV